MNCFFSIGFYLYFDCYLLSLVCVICKLDYRSGLEFVFVFFFHLVVYVQPCHLFYWSILCLKGLHKITLVIIKINTYQSQTLLCRRAKGPFMLVHFLLKSASYLRKHKPEYQMYFAWARWISVKNNPDAPYFLNKSWSDVTKKRFLPLWSTVHLQDLGQHHKELRTITNPRKMHIYVHTLRIATNREWSNLDKKLTWITVIHV